MMITLDVLDPRIGVGHAFFTRRGGVSAGLYESLNCGFGSGDAMESVVQNRQIAMNEMGLASDRLVTCYQIHSAEVVIVERPWSLLRAGVGIVQCASHDTVAEEELFFSYRRSRLRGERAYGRGLSAIVIEQ